MTTVIQTPAGSNVGRTQTADIPGTTRSMTYDEYMATPEETARYDILDGWQVYRLYGDQQLPSPTRVHQRIERAIARPMEDYEQTTRSGKCYVAPVDVLVRRDPLRTRQPDVLFISTARLALNLPEDTADPLSPAPELVVEIVSPSDRTSVVTAKLADYKAAGVQEVWLVRSRTETVEVVRITDDEIETAAMYEREQIVRSLTFPGLAVAVDAIFAG